MPLKKDLFAAEIKDGQEFCSPFLVKTARMADTKQGKPFLTLELMDRSGELVARVWDDAERLSSICPPGAVLQVTGTALSYKGALQLKVSALERVEVASEDWGLFVPAAPGDHRRLAEELVGLFREVADPDLRRLLLAVAGDQTLWRDFCTAPAAKSMHHAYLGGLLEHTLGVCRLAERVCGLYPGLDRSLLLAGAALHDLGKIREFSFAVPPFDYSDQGRLLGHMVIGLELIGEKIAALAGFSEPVATRLKHLIVSHHGCHEFGSPALPMIREAFVLNFIDDLDAKMNYLDRLSRQAQPGQYQWTDYQRVMERYLFVTGHPAQVEGQSEPEPEPEGAASPQEATAGRQPSLWGG